MLIQAHQMFVTKYDEAMQNKEHKAENPKFKTDGKE